MIDLSEIGEAHSVGAVAMRWTDSISVISQKSLMGYSELSQVEDNGAFSRLCSYVRHLFPNKEEGRTPSQRLEHRRLCGLVVPGRDVGPGLPGFSYQPRLWLRGKHSQVSWLMQKDCKTPERKPQVCAQGLWGKSTFWKFKKKKKKILLLSYNLGLFQQELSFFFFPCWLPDTSRSGQQREVKPGSKGVLCGLNTGARGSKQRQSTSTSCHKQSSGSQALGAMRFCKDASFFLPVLPATIKSPLRWWEEKPFLQTCACFPSASLSRHLLNCNQQPLPRQTHVGSQAIAGAQAQGTCSPSPTGSETLLPLPR